MKAKEAPVILNLICNNNTYSFIHENVSKDYFKTQDPKCLVASRMLH
jgi:hypothetical protein